MALPAKDDTENQVENTVTRTSTRDINKNDILADIQEAHQLATQWQEGSLEEKRLVRKLDWRILPCCWVLYLLGFLDRANVGLV